MVVRHNSHVWYTRRLCSCESFSVVLERALVVDKRPGLFQALDDPVRPVQATDGRGLNGREDGQVRVEVVEAFTQRLGKGGGRVGK